MYIQYVCACVCVWQDNGQHFHQTQAKGERERESGRGRGQGACRFIMKATNTSCVTSAEQKEAAADMSIWGTLSIAVGNPNGNRLPSLPLPPDCKMEQHLNATKLSLNLH